MKRAVKSFLATISLLFTILSCSENIVLPDFETNIWYNFVYEDTEGFIKFNHLNDKLATGEYYDCRDWPRADRHEFSIMINPQKLVFSEQDTEELAIPLSRIVENLTYSQYIEAEYSTKSVDLKIYRDSTYRVISEYDVIYGEAQGYYTSLPDYEQDYTKLFSRGILSNIFESKQYLTMDVYMPEDKTRKHPLIMFIHGGAFCGGDKGETAYRDFCSWFAERGYVTASINYRLGFFPYKPNIQKAAYIATQDAHAALRYLVHEARKYNIDVDNIFVGGSSAGAITALNLEFMNSDYLPEGIKSDIRSSKLKGISQEGNSYNDSFTIKGIASMWGAISDISMLNNGSADLIMFHGTEDDIVPYDEGMPLDKIGGLISSLFFDKMYGSASICRHAKDYGIRAELIPFKNNGHGLNVNDDNSINYNHTVIREKMQQFFLSDILGEPAKIVINKDGYYKMQGTDISDNQWKVTGGFIMEGSNEDSIKVLWRDNEAIKDISAQGNQLGYIGYHLVEKIK